MRTIWFFTIAIMIIVIVLGFIDTFFTVQLRGFLGERKVRKVLKSLPKEEYKTVNDVLIPSENGLTQIDHVVVSRYGVFVIETKNMKGQIYGTAFSDEWTKYSQGRKVRFKNPIHQNYGHVKAVQKLLQIDEQKIINLVVMAGSASLEFEGGQNVVYIEELKNRILSYKQEVFPNVQVEDMEHSLIESNQKSFGSRRVHMEMVHRKVEEKENKEYNLICPKCNGRLVLRKGKYGEFYGCSNYPKCRYTKNI